MLYFFSNNAFIKISGQMELARLGLQVQQFEDV